MPKLSHLFAIVIVCAATLGAAPSPSPSASPFARSSAAPSVNPSASAPASSAASAAPSPLAKRPLGPAPPVSPTTSPSGAPPPSVAAIADRFAGVWRCDGYTPSDSGTQTYMRETSDTIALVGAFDSGKLDADRFSYDATHGVWHLTTVSSQTPFVATSLVGDRWVFSGMEGDGRESHPVRVVYTTIGPAAFRREHQVALRDGWTDDGEAVCVRTAAFPVSSPSPSPTRPPRVVARVARPTPSPVPSPTPSPSPSPARDRAYRLVGGTWDCETIEGNAAPHTYRLAADGSILLHTLFSEGTKTFPIDERYRFDRSQNLWTASTFGGSYSSTAPPWLDDKWTFNGVAVLNGVRVPVRMIYTDLDEHAFRRDFRQLRDAVWQTVASETCTRR